MLMTVTSRRAVFELLGTLEEQAEVLQLRGPEMERLIGLRAGVWPMSDSVRELWWPTDEQAERIASLCELCSSVVWTMGPEGAAWIRRRNAGLGYSPIRFILMGREFVDRLRDVLRLEQGQC
jgi:hypothetical protein